VKDRVRRIVDDKTGRMLNIAKDCLILEGAVCSGMRTPGCWFCPRQIYPYCARHGSAESRSPTERDSRDGSRPLSVGAFDTSRPRLVNGPC